MTKKTSSSLKRKNFVLPADLTAWVEAYAAKNNTTMTRLIVDYFTGLKKQHEDGHVEQV